MKVLLIGGGGREHAIAWKLAQSPRFGSLVTAPGNAGTAVYGENLRDLEITDPQAVLQAARHLAADFVFVAPDDPLGAGVVDPLLAEGIPAFGPTRAAAEIEWSKDYANRLMERAGIDTAASRTFDDPDAAKAYVRALGTEVVVKADGLAAGKGVTVCDSVDEALEAIDREMVARTHGAAGSRVVIEERMRGPETSAHAFTDGTTVVHMPFSCDHKPVFDGDRGPNTGGMGVYSPPEWLDETMARRIKRETTEALVEALAQNGRPFSGVIYPGMMVTDYGPRVIEVNSRFGDPETEVLLPRLRSDLLEICLAVAGGRLADVPVEWDDEASVGVVMASGGYPGSYETGLPINGVDAIDEDVEVFIAGAERVDGQLVTSGGRVLCVVAKGATIEEARDRAYDNVPRISFEGAHYRTDIGAMAGQPSIARR